MISGDVSSGHHLSIVHISVTEAALPPPTAHLVLWTKPSVTSEDLPAQSLEHP